MENLIVYIDRQHSGKPARPTDRGAGVDIDGDGRIAAEEREAIFTAKIAVALEIILLNAGATVIPISDGSYKDRHTRVNAYSNSFQGDAIQCYLALHLNAGGGSYAAFFHHHASLSGEKLAAILARKMEEALPVTGGKAIPASSGDWTKNAYATIRGVGRPVAICCEPLFMDTHVHLLNDNGMQSIATAIAQGLKDWMEG